MRKLLLILGIVIMPVQAQAFLEVDWTGNSVVHVNDYAILGSNEYQGQGLGGPIGNQALGFQAYEFTVKEQSIVDYLFVSADVEPHDFYEPEYFIFEGMDVSFLLFEGTDYFGSSGDQAKPGSLVLSSDKYTFRTVDSTTNGIYDGLQIPFKSELNTGNTYWLMADARNEFGRGPAGATFHYTTAFGGRTLTTPEPATMALFAAGFFGIVWRKRRLV